jgi:hypothetical protein
VPKQLLFDDNARAKLLKGVEKLAGAVAVTMGPTGRNVIIDKSFGGPTVTKDGVTVSKEVDLEDPFENMGAKLVNEVASKTSDLAGDGTTTATVLARAIFREGTRNVAAGSNVRTGIWYTSSSYVMGLPATTPYITMNYYASQAGCTSSLTSALVRTNYQFPAFGCVMPLHEQTAMLLLSSPRTRVTRGLLDCHCRYNAYTQCAAPNPAATYETAYGVPQPYANPQLSYGVTCGQVSSTNQFAQINLYTVSRHAMK